MRRYEVKDIAVSKIVSQCVHRSSKLLASTLRKKRAAEPFQLEI